MRGFFMSSLFLKDTKKKPPSQIRTENRYQAVTQNRGRQNGNDLLHKSLKCRVLSVFCLPFKMKYKVILKSKHFKNIYIMKSTFRTLFYLRKNRPNSLGLVPIMIRITIDKEMVQFSAKLDVDPKLWDTKLGRVAARTADATNLNRILDGIKTKIDQLYNINSSFKI